MKVLQLALLFVAVMSSAKATVDDCVIMARKQSETSDIYQKFVSEREICGVCAFVNERSNLVIKEGLCNQTDDGVDPIFKSPCNCTQDDAFNSTYLQGDGNLKVINPDGDDVWKSDTSEPNYQQWALTVSTDKAHVYIRKFTNNNDVAGSLTTNKLWSGQDGNCQADEFDYCDELLGEELDCNDEDVDEVLLTNPMDPIYELDTGSTCITVEDCGELKILDGDCESDDVIFDSNCLKHSSRRLRKLTTGTCDYNCRFKIQGDANFIERCHNWDFTVWKSDITVSDNGNFALVRSNNDTDSKIQVWKYEDESRCTKFKKKFVELIWDLEDDGSWCHHD